MTSITPVRASALKWGVCAHLEPLTSFTASVGPKVSVFKITT
jgi:hypothetical protein